jgi:hypothetical protein
MKRYAATSERGNTRFALLALSVVSAYLVCMLRARVRGFLIVLVRTSARKRAVIGYYGNKKPAGHQAHAITLMTVASRAVTAKPGLMLVFQGLSGMDPHSLGLPTP